MIPETNGAKAHFKQTAPTGRTYWTDLPVVAWDDNGEPLVYHEGRKHLVPADTYSNFDSVRWEDRYIGVLPADGWTLHHAQDDGTVWVEPIAGFLIDSDGWGRPISGSTDGVLQPDQCGDKTELVPPGGWNVTITKETP